MILCIVTSLKAILRGVSANTFTTKTFFCCTMLYNNGYCCVKDISPSHISSQKAHDQSISYLKKTSLKEIILDSHKSFPKRWISRFCLSLRQSFIARYLVCNICCHMTSYESNLKSHLLIKHLFFSSSTSMPRPPLLQSHCYLEYKSLETLREWWKTPTASVYADGQMSVPSA
jgi:hypothetical protein